MAIANATGECHLGSLQQELGWSLWVPALLWLWQSWRWLWLMSDRVEVLSVLRVLKVAQGWKC